MEQHEVMVEEPDGRRVYFRSKRREDVSAMLADYLGAGKPGIIVPSPKPRTPTPEATPVVRRDGDDEPDDMVIADFIETQCGPNMEHGVGIVLDGVLGRRLGSKDPLYQRWGRAIGRARHIVEKRKGVHFEEGGTKKNRTYSVPEANMQA